MFESGGRYVNHGLLPFPGAWVDQPADWVDALHVWLAWREFTREKKQDDDPLAALFGEEDDAIDWRGMIGD